MIKLFSLKNAVDKALYKANTAILVGTSTWLEQFKQAFSVKDDDDDVVESGDVGDEEQKPATCKDYMLHFVSFFWKFLFAFVPPTSKTKFLKYKINKKEIFLNRYSWWMGLFFCINFNYWYSYCTYW